MRAHEIITHKAVTEDASAGACSSSAVAAVSTPLGQPIKRVKKAQPKKDKK